METLKEDQAWDLGYDHGYEQEDYRNPYDKETEFNLFDAYHCAYDEGWANRYDDDDWYDDDECGDLYWVEDCE